MDYCYHCMAEIVKPENPFCPECGKEHNVYYSQSFELPAGTYLNDKRYLVGKSLGSGGFGITYIGFDLKVNRKIVIKETFYNGIFRRNNQNITLSDPLKVEYDDDISLDDIMNKTQKECHCLSKAESFNNIVNVYDWFAENNTAYIITELINGDTLYDRVSKVGVYNWDEVYRNFKPLLQSLAQLHKMGLLHRDIKPHNIMLRQVLKNKEDFVLIDFGLARSSNKTTLATMAAFTPGYSPFEQRTLSKKDGTYTDVYAIAATMYYALSGETPNDEIVGDVLDNFPRLTHLKTSGKISEQVYEAFVSALQPNFRNRCQTIDEFLEELEGEKTYSTPVESPYSREGSGRNSNPTKLASSGSSGIDVDDFLGGGSSDSSKTSFASRQNSANQSYVNIQTVPSQPQQAPIYVSVQQSPGGEKSHFLANFMIFLCVLGVLVAAVAVLDLYDIITIPDLFTISTETDTDTDSGSTDTGSNTNPEDFDLDDYIGQDFDTVKGELEAMGFNVTSRTVYDSGEPDGTILEQNLMTENTVDFAVAGTKSTSSATASKQSNKTGGSVSSTASKSASSTASKSASSTASKSASSTASKSASSTASMTLELTNDDEEEETSNDIVISENSDVSLVGQYTKPVFKYSRYSSCLPDEHVSNVTYTYGEQGVLWGDDDLCWAEGVNGVGIGEYFEFYTPSTQAISQCTLINGYNKNSTVFNNNGRLTVVTFEFSDGSQLSYDIDPDDMGEQTFYFGKVIYTTSLKVIIADAVSGDKYDDTCISFILPK